MTAKLEADLAAVAATLRASSVAVRSQGGRGTGSGIVWSSDGVVVTNAHVAQTRLVEVELADGRRLPGSVDRRDERRDLARIRVDAHDLAAADYRDPGDVRVGELLVAFGHPHGVPNVLTTGIAFSRHRAGVDRFVRADLPLAPGNSGGALADAAGRVIGINSMIAAGLALAIPSDDVRRFMGEQTAVQPLGVQLAAVRLGARRYGYAVLGIVPGSAAERSGVIPGDIILTRTIAALAGATIVNLLRGGRTVTLSIERDDRGSAAAA